MHILLVTDGIYPFVLGGMQKYAYDLTMALAGKGVRTTVVHCIPHGQAGSERQRPEFAALDPKLVDFLSLPFPAQDRWPGHYLRASRRYSEQLWALIKDLPGEYDVVYCQGFTGLAFIKARQAGQLQVPVVTHLHGYEMFQTPPSLKARLTRGPLRAMARQAALGSDGVMNLGRHITDILKRIGLPDGRILECPSAIGSDWLADPPQLTLQDPRVFMFIGRDERRKGIQEINAALRRLIQSGTQGWRFHFVGPMKEQGRVLDPRVVYHGTVRGEDNIKALLRKADVLLCPSWSEGMPTVIMEAMACGTAVIATDVGASGRLVDGTGWLLQCPDPRAIAEAMQEAVTMPAQELLALKRRSVQHIAENFTWERVVEHKLLMLDALIQRRRNAPPKATAQAP